jgi:hypothetical protein
MPEYVRYTDSTARRKKGRWRGVGMRALVRKDCARTRRWVHGDADGMSATSGRTPHALPCSRVPQAASPGQCHQAYVRRLLPRSTPCGVVRRRRA